MDRGFSGRHYETGTIANALLARGAHDTHTGLPYSEALALGASGGIAFGYFVFEYTGHLPHVALLTRNTFSPFERALDNLAIIREARETTDASRAEKNLRLELDAGNSVIVWADMFSLPYLGLDPEQMWAMRPLLVVGQEGPDYLVADGSRTAIRISAEALGHARGRVKKDRHRMMVIEVPDESRINDQLALAVKTCTDLFLEKPPAGSANNFGITGMRFFAKMLTDTKNAKGWGRTFAPGPRLVQALAGAHGQPGVWDWIETWGTQSGADRETYADFLVELCTRLNESELLGVAQALRKSSALWRQLADSSLPDEVFGSLKELKRRHRQLWFEKGSEALEERKAIRNEIRAATQAVSESASLSDHAEAIRGRMAELVLEIADLEEVAMRSLVRSA